MDIDGAPHISVQAGIEETLGILEGSTLGECKFHCSLVRFTRADESVVRPEWGSRVGWFHPFPFLRYFWICFLDEVAHKAKRVPSPIVEFCDSFIDKLGG